MAESTKRICTFIVKTHWQCNIFIRRRVPKTADLVNRPIFSNVESKREQKNRNATSIKKEGRRSQGKQKGKERKRGKKEGKKEKAAMKIGAAPRARHGSASG